MSELHRAGEASVGELASPTAGDPTVVELCELVCAPMREDVRAKPR